MSDSGETMLQIDYYFTVISPFTYLAGTRLEAVAAKHGASIRYKPMRIGAIFAEMGGTPPAKRHPSRVAYRLQELQRLARAAAAPITLAPAHFPTDEAPASRALIAAQEAGFSIGLATHAVLRAVWAEEKDVADPSVVRAALESGGVRWSAIEPHLAAAEAAFEQNTADAIAAGVFGSPFYVIGEERFWGQDRLSFVDSHLAAATDQGGVAAS